MNKTDKTIHLASNLMFFPASQ